MSVTSHATVLSQKFADKVSPLRATVPQPRQGRKMVAQGASPGIGGPHPALPLSGHPSPARAGEGTGERAGSLTHG